MPAHAPEGVHQLFTQYFSTGNLDLIASLYEPDAVLLPQPGQMARGIPAIREVLAGFLAMKGTFQMTPGKVVRANDIAILFSDWTLAATAPDGSSIQLSGQTMDVVRRQADGRWLIVIDSPFGAAGATA
jgi:uncharacterized protein (TIGR02246 family)